MDLRPLMMRAGETAIEVVQGVKPDMLAGPTPCAEFDVRALLNHMCLYSADRSAAAAAKRPVPDRGEDHDFLAEPGWADWYAESAGAGAAAWSEPAAWTGTTGLTRDGEMPASFVGGIVFIEFMMHAWDLAAATGRPLNPDDDLSEALWERIRGTAEMARQYKAFGAEVHVPATAPLLDRALGLAGRDPNWHL